MPKEIEHQDRLRYALLKKQGAAQAVGPRGLLHPSLKTLKMRRILCSESLHAAANSAGVKILPTHFRQALRKGGWSWQS